MTDGMKRGRFAAPVRQGEEVERATGPGSRNIHALLEHLRERGFELAPRFLGLTAEGSRERLSYLPGDTGYPPLAARLRSEAPRWSVWPARFGDSMTPVRASSRPSLAGGADTTIVFDGAEVVGIIDWDFAGPTS